MTKVQTLFIKTDNSWLFVVLDFSGRTVEGLDGVAGV